MTFEPANVDANRGSIYTTSMMIGAKLRIFGNVAATASVSWPANNEAYLIPFLVSFPITFNRAFFVAGTTPGTTNFDIGIYSETFKLLRSLGATAAVNSTDLSNPAGGGAFSTPITLPRGRYYFAMSAASTGLTVRGVVPGNHILRAFGMFKMSSAQPLPATFVPVSLGTTAFVPMAALMTPGVMINN